MKRDEVNVFKALGDKNRIRIIKMLEKRDLCVCEVREVLNLSNSTVSKHLSILCNADLITDFKDGKWVNYRLNARSKNPFIHSILSSLKNSLTDDEQVMNDSKKVRSVDRNKICGI
jgi:ArsR family transcriptional regulator